MLGDLGSIGEDRQGVAPEALFGEHVDGHER
jgi:hypothetical protein